MKKFLIVLAIGAFAACNESGSSTEKAIDSTASANVDSIKSTADSITTAVDSTKDKMVDSTKAMADSLKKKL